MSTKPDGGPAYPSQVPLEYVEEQGKQYANYDWAGMTLRDWFAGQAMAGRLANQHGAEKADIAADAYAYADAMIAERRK